MSIIGKIMGTANKDNAKFITIMASPLIMLYNVI